MSAVFNATGGVVSLPATPMNTLNLAIRASLGQNQITRNVGNFYASFDATNGAVQQQFSIAADATLTLPSGSTGLLVSSNGGALTLNLSKTTGTTTPTVSTYMVTVNQIYVSDDTLSAVSITNPGNNVITGFVAFVPYTFVS